MALLKCPECGKQFSEHAQKCPHCGMPTDDVIRVNRELEEKARREEEERQRKLREEEQRRYEEQERLRAAEEERRHRERAEKEAKEARILAEKRAEEARLAAEKRSDWWKRNGKKVCIISTLAVVIILASATTIKVFQIKAEKRAITEASVLIEQADSLCAAYQFDKAYGLYEKAYRCTDNREIRHSVLAKESQMEDARKQADIEYNNALNKLQVLLDADDYVFNQYSNECLDKMIQIYPDRKETIYYKSLRK